MEVVYQRCAGIDVHQRFLVVCLSTIEAGQRRKEIGSFRTETADLFALRTWLLQEQCSAVGMESTGVYGMAVYRRLEGFFELIVANAQHIKAVAFPKNGCAGRGLDRRFTSAWLAHRQLCAKPATARFARLDEATYQPRPATSSAGQPRP